VEARSPNRLMQITEQGRASGANEGKNGVGPTPTSSRVFTQSERRPLVPLWFHRRWWVLALCLIAGTAGGLYARHSSTPRYSATAQLVVRYAPGAADNAIALALTDASIIPSDQSALQRAAIELNTSLTQVENNVGAEAQAGTSVILVSYKAASQSAAIAGANAVSRALAESGAADSAIPANTLVVVKLATSATLTGLVRSYGIPLGFILGLLIGVIAVLAIERADPRVDDVEDLAQVTETAATAYPGPVPVLELERLIARAGGGAGQVTIAPLSEREEVQAMALWGELNLGSDPRALGFDIMDPMTSNRASLADASGPTVLVVKPNTRSRIVQGSVHRLQMLGSGPVWAVLAVGKGKSLPETPR
jgi:capsular polysaccharide biosynthesis protein